jgi:serine protease Do
MLRWLSWAVLFGLAPSALGQGADEEQAEALQRTMENAIKRSRPSIVSILVSRSDIYKQLTGQGPSKSGKLGDFPALAEDIPSNERQRLRQKYDLADPAHIPEAFGSGVVVDPAGLVLTNYHVIRDATRIYLCLPDGKGSYADIHAADARSDMAILKVRDTQLLPMKAIKFGDASKVAPGQFTLTLANPFVAGGFANGQPTASWGIVGNIRSRVSAARREEDRNRPLFYYGTLLQTDTRTQLSCSGSALLNLQGELIGLSNAMVAIHGGETPGGYAVPIDPGMVRILDVLRRGEEVDYGFLGIPLGDSPLNVGKGVSVAGDPIRGSPAEKEAHLRPHDLILALNDMPIKETNDLLLHLGTQLAGTKVTFKVQRANSREVNKVEVTLGKYNFPGKSIASSLGKRPFFRGMRVDYTTLLVQRPNHFPEVPAGVMISEIEPDSSADSAQLKVGEVITHVNKSPVTTPAAFYQAVGQLQGTIECRIYTFGGQEPGAKVFLK